MFDHVHINDNLAGRAAFANFDLCSFKETERADAFCAFADFARVEGIALNRAELATDDAIQCGCVSFNVDPLDKDAGSTGQDKFDIQRQITVIARDPRLGTQEVDPLADCERLKSSDRVFDKRWIVDNAGAQTQDIAELIRVCLRHLAGDGNVAKGELLAFGDINNKEHTIAFFGDFGVGAVDPHIDITARQVEIAQDLAVELQPVLNQGISANESAQQACLFGLQNPTQTAVREHPVAHKRHALHLSGVAFRDLKHQVDAVVAAADDARRHGRSKTPLGTIGLSQGGGVALCDGRIEDPARRRLDQRQQCVILDAAVAFKADPADGREFGDFDDQRVAARHDFHALEHTAVQNALVGVIQLARAHGFATLDAGVGNDCRGLNALIALNLNVCETIALSGREIRRQGKSQGNSQRCRRYVFIQNMGTQCAPSTGFTRDFPPNHRSKPDFLTALKRAYRVYSLLSKPTKRRVGSTHAPKSVQQLEKSETADPCTCNQRPKNCRNRQCAVPIQAYKQAKSRIGDMQATHGVHSPPLMSTFPHLPQRKTGKDPPMRCPPADYQRVNRGMWRQLGAEGHSPG